MRFAGTLVRENTPVVCLAAAARRLSAALLAVVVVVGPSSEIRGDEKPADSQDEDVAVDVGAESASHSELDALPVEFEKLTALCWNVDGNLLACDAGAKQIKVIGRDGNQVGTINLEFGPEAVDVAADGTIYCGGQGQLAKLNQDGATLKCVEIPEEAEPAEEQRRRASPQKHRISGLAVTERDLFAAIGAGGGRSSRSKLFRFDRDVDNPTLLAEDLRACCQRCDVAAVDGKLYLAENCAHRVVCYDRDGNALSRWGEQSRTELEGFGSCCNPMNLYFDAAGVLYTAESGVGRVKRYSRDGEFLGLVGYVGTDRFSKASSLAISCSNIAIAVTPDGERVYVMDYKKNLIRVLQRKPATSAF